MTPRRTRFAAPQRELQIPHHIKVVCDIIETRLEKLTRVPTIPLPARVHQNGPHGVLLTEDVPSVLQFLKAHAPAHLNSKLKPLPRRKLGNASGLLKIEQEHIYISKSKIAPGRSDPFATRRNGRLSGR